MRSKRFVVSVVSIIFLFGLSVALAQTFGVKKKRPKPVDYGKVVINSHAETGGAGPVVFQHWVHRSKYTCRLCHVDIGFAMVTNETMITCDDNRGGFYCGSCHNGEVAFEGVEKTALGREIKNCDRCHSEGKEVDFEHDFNSLARRLPRERFGNGIDWEKAELDGLISLEDFLPGVSIKRQSLKDPLDLEVKAREAGMPDIIFSHEKHAVWSGCELCHPEIFGVKTGATVYSMQQIFDGKYCGACHGSVAFPNLDCQRCHTKAVI